MSFRHEQHSLTIEEIFNLALQHHNAGRLSEAKSIYLKILQHAPDHPVALRRLGIAEYQTGNVDKAIECLQRALAIKPDYAEAHNNLGTVYSGQGKQCEAMASYQEAFAHKPDYAEAHNNLANALNIEGRLDEALAHYHKAIDIKYDFADAHNNLGNALKEMGQLDEAMACYRQALAIHPGFSIAHSNMLFTEQYFPDVRPEKLQKAHADWDARHGIPLQTKWRDHDNTPEPNRKLRVGFVSPNLGSHPVGYFVLNLFEYKPTEEIEVICYSNRMPDDMTRRLRANVNEWTDVQGLSDDALAQRIRSDHIDILIDLSGHMDKSMLLVMARKPAPIQVKWVGYPGSTGLSAIDYLIADKWHAPEHGEDHHPEKTIRMPDGYVSYKPPPYAPAVGPLPFDQNGFMTFGCFNNPAKINDLVLSSWMEILKAVPNSRLTLKYRNMDTESNRVRFLKYFTAHKIAPSRLILEGHSPHADLLARYHGIDIALDTSPYNGGLTTCEAIWMGVPVISKSGKTFAGRHSLSHLSNIGLPELVAEDEQGYVAKAVELANNVPRLSELRSGLRKRMANSALCDGKKFATDFASEMRRIWKKSRPSIGT